LKCELVEAAVNKDGKLDAMIIVSFIQINIKVRKRKELLPGKTDTFWGNSIVTIFN
jgi:hypothetical protein